MIVPDASAIVDVLIGDAPAGLRRRLLEAGSQELHVPQLHDLEVASALRRKVRLGLLDGGLGGLLLRQLGELRLTRYPHAALLERVWALRENFSVYDAAYVTLAEALSAVLITTDRGMAQAARDLVEVELYA